MDHDPTAAQLPDSPLPEAAPSGSAAPAAPNPAMAVDVAEAEAFVALLARELHRYGSPAHRLEEAMRSVAQKLGLEGEFFCTPTAIFASFRPVEAERRGEPPHTFLLRLEPGEMNLERLSLLDSILLRVLHGELAIEAATAEIAAAAARPPRYGRVLTVLAFAGSSAATARFFGGGLLEAGAAAAIGLLIGLLALFAESRPATGLVFEALAAALAAFSASAAAARADASFLIVTVSALIVLMPGLTLTTAVSELAMRHLASGSARLAGALLVFMALAVGFALGSRCGTLVFGPLGPHYPPPQPFATEVLALLVAAASLLVLFRARPRDLALFFGAATLALAGSRLGSNLLGPQLCALAGAVVVGAAAHLYARWLNRPSVLVQLPGLMVLVPGSLGFRSVAALLEEDTLAGVQSAFTVVLIAISLAMGLLIASAIVPPRRVF